MRIRFTRRRIAIATAVAIIAASGGTAYAYFTSTGSGTGNATVGTAGTWTVTAGSPSGGPLYPGSGTETIAFTVTNSGVGSQEFSSAVASVPIFPSTTDAEAGPVGDPTDITGCTASWFVASVTGDPGLNTEIAHGDSVTVTVTVTLSEVDVDQSSCESASPLVTLNVS